MRGLCRAETLADIYSQRQVREVDRLVVVLAAATLVQTKRSVMDLHFTSCQGYR